MPLLQNLLGRIGTNLGRVLEDVAPVAAAAAPFLVPGLGGLAISQGLNFLTDSRSSPVQNAARSAVVQQRACPSNQLLGRGFSAPFQSAFFRSGGSLPGRGLQADFRPRFIMGREVSRCPPTACPCPGGGAGAPGLPPVGGSFLTRAVAQIRGVPAPLPVQIPEAVFRVPKIPDFSSAFRF